MKRILSADNVEILAQYAWSRVLLAFDFDGTLAPIVTDRDRAGMRATTHRLLERVCRLYPCAIISGRSRTDVTPRLKGIGVRYVMGNHGLEPGKHMGKFERQIAMIRPLLEEGLGGMQGVDVEDKRFSLAVHYRRSRRKRDARKAIYDTVNALPFRMRTIPGKLVVNVIPERAPHKGDALLELRTKEGADTAIYVGDDATDEDVFMLDQPGRLLSIRVGLAHSSSASYFLRNQREIDALLARLARLRTSDGRP
jgi:trehalose 6-phosphate phosphatase